MLGLAAAVVVVGIAAHAPLSGSTPVDAHAAQGPTTALLMVLVGVGIVMVGAIVLMAWSGRRRGDDPPEREPTRIVVPWYWKLVTMLATFGVGAALVVGAVLGTRSLDRTPRFAAPSSFAPGGPLPRGAPSGAPRGGFVVPTWLPWTLLGIVGISIAAGLAVMWLRRGRPDAPDPDAEIAAVQAATAAIAALDAESDPRRAVIAAYTAMQRTLGDHGVVRAPAEAPREYLRRALLASRAGRASERELTTLTRLFEEARYSVHPIPERTREAAFSALSALQGVLKAEGVR